MEVVSVTNYLLIITNYLLGVVIITLVITFDHGFMVTLY